MKRANLIPRPRIEARQRRRRVRVWVAVCVAYAAALAAGGGASLALEGAADNSINDELAHQRSQIDATNKDVSITSQALAEAQANLAANREVAGQPDWSVLLALLAANLGDDVVLSSCEMAPLPATSASTDAPGNAKADVTASTDRFIVRLTGKGKTQADVSRFVLRLEQLTLFSRVKLIDTRSEPFLAGRAVAFNLECTLEPNPARRAQR